MLVEKKKSTLRWLLTAVGWVTLLGCQPAVLSQKDYIAFMNDPSNGLIQYKTIAERLRISAQYVPIDYLAYGDLLKLQLPHTTAVIDSLKLTYKHSTTFYIHVESLDPKLDLRSFLCDDITNTLKMTEALTRLDESFSTGLSLSAGQGKYAPSLCIRESSPSVSGRMSFIAVFPVSVNSLSSGRCTVVWNDTAFQAGRQVFEFDVGDLANTPSVRL